jgi:hypothetical protein
MLPFLGSGEHEHQRIFKEILVLALFSCIFCTTFQSSGTKCFPFVAFMKNQL